MTLHEWTYDQACERVMEQEDRVKEIREQLRVAEYELNLRYAERSRANVARLLEMDYATARQVRQRTDS